MSCPDCGGRCENSWHGRNIQEEHDVDHRDGVVLIALSMRDARQLYEHTGTMPFAPGSWSHHVRAELSSALSGEPRRTHDDRVAVVSIVALPESSSKS